MDGSELTRKFPRLFQEVTWPWGPTRARFRLLDKTPAERLIANVNLVPYTGRKWVVIQLADGTWEIPGGTLEPGEDYLQALRRELREETGAQLIKWQLIGGWECISQTEQPYRPHLPFPEYYRLVLCGEIQLGDAPENPPGGEPISSAESISLELVVDRFTSQQRPSLAELYQLAAMIIGRNS